MRHPDREKDSEEETCYSSSKSKKKITGNKVAAALVVIVIALGLIGVFQNEALNQLSVELGTEFVIEEVIREHPEYRGDIEQMVTTLERLLETTDPTPAVVDQTLAKVASKMPASHSVLNPIIAEVAVLGESTPQQQYTARLRALIRGVKKALADTDSQ